LATGIFRPSRSSSAQRLSLARILVFAVVVRASVVLSAWWITGGVKAFHSLDTEGYVAPARELLTHGTFTVHGQPELIRTPGYPLLLAIGIILGHLEGVTIAIQIVISALTVAGVYVLVDRLVDDNRTALLAAALYSIEPLSILYSAMLLTETFFTGVLVWGLVLAVVRARGGSVASLMAGSALLAATAYIRPAGYFLPFCVLGILALHALLKHRWSQWRPLLLATGAAALVLAPWQLRNRALGYAGMSAITAEYMYFYNAAALRAASSGASFAAVQTEMGYGNDSVYLALHPEQRAWSPGERYRFMAAQGSREVTQNIPRYSRIYLAGLARVLFDPGAIDLLKLYGLYPTSGGLLSLIVTAGLINGLTHLLQSHPLAIALLILLGLVLATSYVLAIRGLAGRLHLKDPAVALLLASAVYLVAIAGGPAGLNRFRHPVMPIICAFAAVGLRHGHSSPETRTQVGRVS
jgi:4-amino-4-deoxy-L-arabinose transferase-like glycosyltransferase